MKAVGAMLVIGACLIWSIKAVSRLSDHARTLKALSSSLGLAKSEICAHLSPMQDVLEILASYGPVPADAFYKRVLSGMEKLGQIQFSQIWSNAAENSPELCLTVEEREELMRLGMSLGRYDVAEQACAIERTIERFDGFAARAEEEKRRDGRMHAMFPVAAGLLAVVILI